MTLNISKATNSLRQATEFATFNLFAGFLNLYLYKDLFRRHVYDHKHSHLMQNMAYVFL